MIAVSQSLWVWMLCNSTNTVLSSCKRVPLPLPSFQRTSCNMSRVLKFTFVYIKTIPQKSTNEVVSCPKHVIKFLSNILSANTTIMRAHLPHTTCTQPRFKLVYLVCFSQCAEGRTAHEKNHKKNDYACKRDTNCPQYLTNGVAIFVCTTVQHAKKEKVSKGKGPGESGLFRHEFQMEPPAYWLRMTVLGSLVSIFPFLYNDSLV